MNAERSKEKKVALSGSYEDETDRGMVVVCGEFIHAQPQNRLEQDACGFQTGKDLELKKVVRMS